MTTGVKKLKISENVERQTAPRILVQEADGSVGYVAKDSIGSGSGIGGTQYSYVAGKGTPTENATELQTAYNLSKTISGLSATNRYKILVGTGKYDFGESPFEINTQYIDFVSLTGDADVNIMGGVSVNANDVYLKGLTTTAQFQLADNLNLLVCDNCVGGDYSFGGGEYGGGLASGTFINCVGGWSSFGGVTASGTFTNCVGGDYSFGGGNYGGGLASGTFTNCVGGGNSFGGGGNYGLASGTFTNCVGGGNSFGGVSIAILTGKLFYCRLTAGTFPTVSSGGRTYYCVDGNGNVNNQ